MMFFFFYLGLLDSLDCDAIAVVVIGGDIGKAKLAVSEQSPDDVSIIEILSVTKIDALTVRYPSPVPPLDLVLALLCLLLVFITSLLTCLPLRRRMKIRVPATGATSGGFRRRETETHVMIFGSLME